MSQSDRMIPNKFSLIPGNITRFFLLLIVVLLVAMGVIVQSAVNTWLKDKSYQIVDITHGLQKGSIPIVTPPGKSMTTSPFQPHPQVTVCKKLACARMFTI